MSACAGPARHQTTFTGPTMGTTFTVKVITEQALEPEVEVALEHLVLDALYKVDAAMSTYRDDSDISRFNAWHSTEPFAVSRATFEVLEIALAVAEQSDGALDVTVAPLVNAWGFGRTPLRGTLPSDEEIAVLLGRTGYTHLSLDSKALTVQKDREDVTCDVSAIAKGYAVDRVAQALLGAGYDEFMVEVGGEIITRGRNLEGEPWRLAIERPTPAQRSLYRVISLSEWALATSGDYRNFFERDGRRYSHTLDPRTGWPVSHPLASVSVLERSCALADAWATALNVLGPEAGYRLALERELAVLFLIYNDTGDNKNRIDARSTPAFDALVRQD